MLHTTLLHPDNSCKASSSTLGESPPVSVDHLSLLENSVIDLDIALRDACDDGRVLFARIVVLREQLSTARQRLNQALRRWVGREGMIDQSAIDELTHSTQLSK